MRIFGVITLLLAIAAPLAGQAAKSAKTTAPTDADFTGYWVSLITEDWRWRMVTPAKGDYASIPLTLKGKETADTWDPAKDEAAGNECRSYGAPGIMRAPARLHITWQDEETLKVDIDYGQQTRLLRFANGSSATGPATWQGNTVANWEAGPATGQETPSGRPKYASIKTVTTHLRPGYLRKNGVPYSGEAVLTEYWDVNKEPNGSQTLLVTTAVHDPMYLQRDWITALEFKKEPDGSKWDPQPCNSRW